MARPCSETGLITRLAEDLTFSEALPIATPRPAHSIISMSLGAVPDGDDFLPFHT